MGQCGTGRGGAQGGRRDWAHVGWTFDTAAFATVTQDGSAALSQTRASAIPSGRRGWVDITDARAVGCLRASQGDRLLQGRDRKHSLTDGPADARIDADGGALAIPGRAGGQGGGADGAGGGGDGGGC